MLGEQNLNELNGHHEQHDLSPERVDFDEEGKKSRFHRVDRA